MNSNDSVELNPDGTPKHETSTQSNKSSLNSGTHHVSIQSDTADSHNDEDGNGGGTESSRPVYTADVKKYAKISAVGTILSILSLGVYRSWYLTKLRQYVWSHTKFLGDNFEYHGTGIELFIGFLIAVAITLPLFLITQIGLLGLSEEELIISFLIAYYILFLFFIQYAIYRGRAYRLSRTSWRGIRCRQSGSGLYYAWFSFWWILFTFLTLGAAYPWMRTAQIRYRINNTWFGSQRARFEGGARGFARHYFKAYGLLSALAFIPFTLTIMVGGRDDFVSLTGSGAAASFLGFILTIVISMSIGAISLLYIGIPYIRARELRVFASQAKLCEASAKLDVKALFFYGRFLLFYLVLNIIFGIIGLSIFLVITSIGSEVYLSGFNKVTSIMGGNLAIEIITFALIYLIGILIYTIVYAAIFKFPVTKHIIESVHIYNAESIIANVGEEDNSTGLSEALSTIFEVEFGF